MWSNTGKSGAIVGVFFFFFNINQTWDSLIQTIFINNLWHSSLQTRLTEIDTKI